MCSARHRKKSTAACPRLHLPRTRAFTCTSATACMADRPGAQIVVLANAPQAAQCLVTTHACVHAPPVLPPCAHLLASAQLTPGTAHSTSGSVLHTSQQLSPQPHYCMTLHPQSLPLQAPHTQRQPAAPQHRPAPARHSPLADHCPARPSLQAAAARLAGAAGRAGLAAGL